jgi:hypothetical protein
MLHIHHEVTVMRLTPYCAIPTLIFSFACTTPEYKLFQHSPPPLEVAVNIKVNSDGVQYLEKEFAAALRSRLANLVTVVPEGVIPPPDVMRLDIEIDRITQKNTSPAAIGAATGAAIGTLVAASNSGNHNGMPTILYGLARGLQIGAEAEAIQRHNDYMRGYIAPKITGLVSLSLSNSYKPLYTEAIPTRAVIDEMAPLRDVRIDYASINEELVRAFARAIANQLQSRFNWYAKRTQSWYEPAKDK